MPSILAGSGLVGVLHPDGGAEHLKIGIMFGTLFAQTTLASVWAALGPLALLYRLPLSLLWVSLLVCALAINIGSHGGPEPGVMLVIAACALGQWLLVQMPLWALAVLYGLRLQHRTDVQLPGDVRHRQFGIRQVMVFTAIVGVMLGLGRVVVLNITPAWFPGLGREAPVFIFLAVAAIAMTLPLVLASLLRSLAALGILLTLVLIGLGTWIELPVLKVFHSGPGPDEWHLIFINLFTTVWILAFMLGTRLCGYQFQGVSAAADASRST